METKLTTQEIEILIRIIEEFRETLILDDDEVNVIQKLRLMINE